ncbi:MAG: hypothetical protein ABR968_08390, partial [Bacteroidales bacterium]
MNRFILIAIGLIIVTPIYSQKHNDFSKYTYNIMQNEPENMENFVVSADFLKGDLYSPNFNFGFGGSVYYRFKNLFSVKLTYDCGILDRIDEPTIDDDYAMNTYLGGSSFFKSTPKTSVDYIGEYYFSGKIKQKKQTVHLKTSGRVEYVGLIPANLYDQWALRGGLQTFRSYFAASSSAGGSTPLSGYMLGDASKTVETLSGGSMFYDKTIVLGISRVRNVNLTVNVEGLGERTSKYITEAYFDILFAPTITIEDMIIAKKGYYDAYGNIINDPNTSSQYTYSPFYYRYVV